MSSQERLGGRVVAWESQPRWRPACFFELERDGEILPLYWRGARGEFHTSTKPLVREGAVIDVLEVAEAVLLDGVAGETSAARAAPQVIETIVLSLLVVVVSEFAGEFFDQSFGHRVKRTMVW